MTKVSILARKDIVRIFNSEAKNLEKTILEKIERRLFKIEEEIGILKFRLSS